MRGTLWLVLISLPTAMILAAGLFAIEVTVFARAAPASPFYELAETAMEAVAAPNSGADMGAAIKRLMPAMVRYYIPFGGLACLLAGLAGGAMSRDARPAWFALTPLLMLPALPVLTIPWTVVIAPFWALAATGGVALLRIVVDRSQPV